MRHLQYPILIAVVAATGATLKGRIEPATEEAPTTTAAAVVLVMSPAPPAPHFRLLEPASWIVENERGDPQKAGPCGGTNTDWGKPTYIVNEAKGGAMQHIKLVETVFHPGHFRVALAVNSPMELPPDPVATTRTDTTAAGVVRANWSTSAAIEKPEKPPVLADGLFVRTQRPETLETFETDVMLPNINCDHCFLQVVQFMTEHAFNNPGGYTYHHCAIMHITADPSKPIDTRWPEQRKTD